MPDADDITPLSHLDNLLSDLFQHLPPYARLLAPPSSIIDQLVRARRSPWENEGIPFERFERDRSVQYLSMLNEPINRGIAFTEGGWEDTLYEALSNSAEGGRSLDGNGLRSLTSTPDANKPRVKMSLADYKKGGRKTTMEVQRSKEVKKGEVDRKKGKSQVQLSRNDDSDKKDTPVRSARPAEKYEGEQSGSVRKLHDSINEERKRKLGEDRIKKAEREESKEALRHLNEMLKRKEADKFSAKESQHTLQQARKSQTSATKNSESAKSRESKQIKAPAKKLPPMLSPLPDNMAVDGESDEEERKLDDRFYNFPPILSPLLPAVVEEAFSRLQDRDSSFELDSVGTVGTTHQGSPSSQDQPSTDQSSSRNPITDSHDKDTKIVYKQKQERSIVRLPYGRRNSKNVEGLLKLKPKPRPTSTSIVKPDITASLLQPTIPEKKHGGGKRPAITQVDVPKQPVANKSDNKQVETKTHTEKQIDERKRPRGDLEESQALPSAKRAKAPNESKRASPGLEAASPVKKLPQSPLPSNKGTTKLLETPIKHEIPSKKTMNDHDTTIATPIKSAPGVSQPIWQPVSAGAVLSALHAPSASVEPVSPKAQQEKIHRDHQRLQALGTELKRDMDKLLKSKVKDPPPIEERDAKLGVLTGIESSVTYMLCYEKLSTYLKRAKSSKDGSDEWLSVLMMVRFVVDKSRPYKELHSCALLVVAVIREFLDGLFFEKMNAGALLSKDEAMAMKLAKDMLSNGKARPTAWAAYAESLPVGSPVCLPGLGVAGSIEIILSTLKDFDKKEGLGWTRKLGDVRV